MARKGKGKKSRKGRRASYFSPARRAARKARRRARRSRGGPGIAGKAGIGIIVGAPLLGTGIETAADVEAVMRLNQKDPPTPLSLARIGFWNGLNHLSMGFGGGNVRDSVPMTHASGSVETKSVGSAIPSGAWWKTSVPGFFLVGADIVYSWGIRLATGVKNGVRLFGRKWTSGK